MEFERKPIADRDPVERLKDWEETHVDPDFEKVQTQGARCMDCGTPYCHTGMTLSNMASGCPINNLIPEFNDLVYKGKWQDAYLPPFQDQQLPGVYRPRLPCSLRGLLRSRRDRTTRHDQEHRAVHHRQGLGRRLGHCQPHPPNAPARKSPSSAPVPAGLAAADQLNQAGHLVTVYERADRIGGLLMYGIPNMKLQKEIVNRRVDLMREEGVTFVTSTEIGKDISSKQLLDDFDAVILCCGATKPRDLPIEGREFSNIRFAMEFLGPNTRSSGTSVRASPKSSPNWPRARTWSSSVAAIPARTVGTSCAMAARA